MLWTSVGTLQQKDGKVTREQEGTVAALVAELTCLTHLEQAGTESGTSTHSHLSGNHTTVESIDHACKNNNKDTSTV
jgi:hypothetical protein